MPICLLIWCYIWPSLANKALKLNRVPWHQTSRLAHFQTICSPSAANCTTKNMFKWGQQEEHHRQKIIQRLPNYTLFTPWLHLQLLSMKTTCRYNDSNFLIASVISTREMGKASLDSSKSTHLHRTKVQWKIKNKHCSGSNHMPQPICGADPRWSLGICRVSAVQHIGTKTGWKESSSSPQKWAQLYLYGTFHLPYTFWLLPLYSREVTLHVPISCFCSHGSVKQDPSYDKHPVGSKISFQALIQEGALVSQIWKTLLFREDHEGPKKTLNHFKYGPSPWTQLP